MVEKADDGERRGPQFRSISSVLPDSSSVLGYKNIEASIQPEVLSSSMEDDAAVITIIASSDVGFMLKYKPVPDSYFQWPNVLATSSGHGLSSTQIPQLGMKKRAASVAFSPDIAPYTRAPLVWRFSLHDESFERKKLAQKLRGLFGNKSQSQAIGRRCMHRLVVSSGTQLDEA